MSETLSSRARVYSPDYIITPPALYAWPPSLLGAVRYLLFDMLFPWGYLYAIMAIIGWHFLTPSLETMSEWSWGWVGLIWLRNAGLLTLVAGGLYWWLYIRKSQGTQYKFDKRWMATGDSQFLWRNQVKDNMFWSLVSGVTIWTLYESVTLWFYASGRQPVLSLAEHPGAFMLSIYGVFFWSTATFYFIHRALHWRPLYKLAHELHHRNVNIGPWSGISMHPIEHAIYFAPFMLWWFVPCDPIIILLTGFFQGISPAVSHCGFDFLKNGDKKWVTAGDYFHQLHHQYFHVNYGNTPTPFDKLFDSWHDGTESGKELLKGRMRHRRRQVG